MFFFYLGQTATGIDFQVLRHFFATFANACQQITLAVEEVWK